MYHSRKKAHKVISPEEEAKNREISSKINAKIKDFLNIRQNPSKVTDPLKYTAIMANITPEIYTIFNFRKEIILNHIESFTLEAKYDFLSKELDTILPLMMQYPKSYSLWHHRKWVIIHALELEKQNPQMNRTICKKELKLCSQMLAKDERNFHVWNYRNWILNSTKSYDDKAIDNEIEFIESKLKQNFSNFSALHFKSKTLGYKNQDFLAQNKMKKISELMTSQTKKQIEEILLFGYQLNFIISEFPKVKTGIFMQSNEQSMWLYLSWLLNLITPIRIRSFHPLSFEDGNLTILTIFTTRLINLKANNLICRLHDGDQIINLPLIITSGLPYSASAFWKFKIALPEKYHVNKFNLEFEFINTNQHLDNADLTLEDIMSNMVSDIDNKTFLSYETYKVHGDTTHLDYTSNNKANEYTTVIDKIFKEQFELIEELFLLEPHNRFAHSHMIKLLITHEDIYSNDLENLKKRVKITEKVLKSSMDLLAYNPRLKNRFESLLKFYSMKMELLNSLMTSEKTQKLTNFLEDEDLMSMNLEELADLILLNKFSIPGENEISNTLKLLFNSQEKK